MLSATAPAHFAADLKRFDRVLAPFTVTIGGHRFMPREAPPLTAAAYGRLMQMGYANGWVS